MTPALAAPDDVVATAAHVRPGNRPPLIVLDSLEAFLDGHGLGHGPISVAPIGEGHSNVTYALRRAGAPGMVLRRPPRPPLPPSAHDVAREARVVAALADTPARVPSVLASCSDESVIGAPFFLMDHVDGEVIVSNVPAALDTPAERTRIGWELIDALVEIHSVDWRAVGLADFGRPSGYLERQLRRFGGLWETNRTRELGAIERVAHWLAEHLPDSSPATLVHGDYRLGNAIFGASPPARLAAVLDWEMATIGDPLADVGYLCMMWAQPGDPPEGLRGQLGGVTRAEGFPTRAQLVARYEERSGRAVQALDWYVTLALWKAAIFMEGNYKRALAGTTDDPYLAQFGEGVAELATAAEQMTRHERD
jgi:aminoglycoside phosphotransferase (APT) family kinase protein